MSGGLMQLVAFGAQDVYYTMHGNSNIKFNISYVNDIINNNDNNDISLYEQQKVILNKMKREMDNIYIVNEMNEMNELNEINEMNEMNDNILLYE